jgi:prepilin-type N-terminal cleavage/methylation domain-containing protein
VVDTGEDIKAEGFTHTNSHKNLDGFTIPELLIATAVFSVILMVAMASFLQIGRMFYKGITISQTKETAQHILDSVSADLQYADSGSNPTPITKTDYSYMCIHGSRYTYMLKHEIDSSRENWSDSTKPKDFGLLYDKMKGADGCGDPFASTAPLQNPVEMLGNKMRLSKFEVSLVPEADNLYNVNVNIAYGDDDVLVLTPDPSKPTCIGDLKSSEFCSVINISTLVSKNFSF